MHGPQTSAIEAFLGVEHYDESAVKVDAVAPLDLREVGTRRRGPCVRLDRAGHEGSGDDGAPAVFSNTERTSAVGETLSR